MEANFRVEDGIVYVSVTSDGATGREWVRRLQNKQCHMLAYIANQLLSPDFETTSGVQYNLAIMKDGMDNNEDRTLSGLTNKATEGGFRLVHPEVVCLLTEVFTPQIMEGLGMDAILPLTQPWVDPIGVPRLLYLLVKNDSFALKQTRDANETNFLPIHVCVME